MCVYRNSSFGAPLPENSGQLIPFEKAVRYAFYS